MKGLILKDIYNLRKYGKTVGFITVFYIALTLIINDANISMLTSMIVLMFAITSITSFAYDKQSGWDAYVISMPVSRRSVVLSKYVLSFLLAFTGGIIALLLGFINGIIKNSGYFSETLLNAYTLFVVSLLLICLLLPLVYKFGVERSRVILIAVVAILVSGGIALGQAGALSLPAEQTAGQMLLLSPVILIFCYMLSFAISHAIYRKKEM